MARYKGYDYSQIVLIPVLFENQLLPGTLEFAIQELVERRPPKERMEEETKN